MGLRLVVAPNATPGVECPACAQILQREKGRGVVMMMKSSSGSSVLANNNNNNRFHYCY